MVRGQGTNRKNFRKCDHLTPPAPRPEETFLLKVKAAKMELAGI
jgi:hypothetical protein